MVNKSYDLNYIDFLGDHSIQYRQGDDNNYFNPNGKCYILVNKKWRNTNISYKFTEYYSDKSIFYFLMELRDFYKW